jgi:hypothetical protein
MTVQDTRKIDRLGIDRESGDVRLMISDHLNWDEDEGEHLLTLQEKLNNYLEFVESGQLYKQYPQAAGRKIVFYVMGKFPLSDEAAKFYLLAGQAIQKYGCSLQFVHYKPNEEREIGPSET